MKNKLGDSVSGLLCSSQNEWMKDSANTMVNFFLSPGPGHVTQLFCQTLCLTLLWRYFVGVISIYNQFTLSNACYWRRQSYPTPVLLPGKSHGWRSLVGCSPWGRYESDTTDWLHFHFSTFMHWRRKWHPTPVFLPGESQGLGILVGCRLRGCTESDTTEAT